MNCTVNVVENDSSIPKWVDCITTPPIARDMTSGGGGKHAWAEKHLPNIYSLVLYTAKKYDFIQQKET